MGLLRQHAQAPPTPPSARTDLPIPKALDELVLSCLAKNPAHRPQSARELSLRLAEVDGANAWTQDRAWEWWATLQPPLS
jgi:serine/threonine-protein kinase